MDSKFGENFFAGFRTEITKISTRIDILWEVSLHNKPLFLGISDLNGINNWALCQFALYLKQTKITANQF